MCVCGCGCVCVSERMCVCVCVCVCVTHKDGKASGCKALVVCCMDCVICTRMMSSFFTKLHFCCINDNDIIFKSFRFHARQT